MTFKPKYNSAASRKILILTVIYALTIEDCSYMADPELFKRWWQLAIILFTILF